MNRISIKENARNQISGNIGIFLLIFLTTYAIDALLLSIPAVGPVLSFALGSILSISIINICLELTGGTAPQYTRLFDIFKNSRLCGNAILLSILTYVYTLLWSLLFIVPGIIKSLSYSMAPYILSENEYYMSPSDAIKESMRIMQGHKMELFVLELSFIGWTLLSVITCGLVGIYFCPYYNMAHANFYNSIKESKSYQDYDSPEI